MKRIFMVLMMCSCLISWTSAGYCQDDSADDSAIEGSESAVGENLDSEIAGEQGQSAAEMGEMDLSMDTGGHTN